MIRGSSRITKHVNSQLEVGFSNQQYKKIRDLWKHHSISEDDRNIDGLLSTLTDDCEYVIMPSGDKWVGKEGASQFYQEVLNAYPDIHFELQNIVIGPQGVFEEAIATGTLMGNWRHWIGDGQKVVFPVQIFFPWCEKREKFKGERVFLDYNRILSELIVKSSL